MGWGENSLENSLRKTEFRPCIKATYVYIGRQRDAEEVNLKKD